MNLEKIDPHLQHQFQAADADDDSVAVIIAHRGEMFFSQAEGDVTSYTLINASALRIPHSAIDALSEQDEVAYIWADLPVHTCLDVSVPKINVPPLAQQGLDGSGIKLAIVDTGIDFDHPDFAGRIKNSASFVGGNAGDGNGHGTHVAGIAAGTGAASGGKYSGVAPAADLYIARVLDAEGNGSMSGVMSGVEWAVQQGAQVINMSLGSAGPCDGSDALSTLCNAAVTQKGVVLCVAAGNEGPGASTVGAPGCAIEVITIGASDDRDNVTSFSSRGPTSDGRVKPDVLFPGKGIVAAQAAGTQLGPGIAPQYISLDGTSMATPHAAGVVCLLLQSKPDLTPAQIKAAMQQTAIDLGLPANTQGAGRVDALQTLNYATDNNIPVPTPTPGPTPTPAPSGCLPSAVAKLFKQ